jgi:pimeloyl-ACP methyl ester carboxylesterase
LILLAAVALAALAVSSALAANAASAPSAATGAVPRLVWHRCASPEQQGFQCATARVPLDYLNPRGPTIHLAVIRHRASDRVNRIGMLFFNPGGPAAPGTLVLAHLYQVFPAALRARFDIVSWDPRGVGASTAVQCFPSAKDESDFFAGIPFTSFPVNSGEMLGVIRRIRRFGRACARRNDVLLRHVSTADTARDLDFLRRAVGAPMLNYLGDSYGTFLGATYANLFPRRVRAMVLDSNVNPSAWVGRGAKQDGEFLSTWLRQRSDQGSAKTLGAFLDLCGRTDTAHCAFSAASAPATRAKFRALLRRLLQHPAGAKMSYAELVSATVSALYNPFPLVGGTGWSGFAKVLQSAWTNGTQTPPHVRGLPMPTQGVPAVGGDQTPGATERYAGPEQALAIYCAESPNPSPFTFPTLDVLSYRRSGPVGPFWSWNAEPCASWPATAADRYAGPWNRRTAHPILVVGTTYDPATPYQGAVAMTHQLARARLLTVDGYGHGEIGTSACVDRYESRYFITGALPAPGTRCRQDRQPFAE